MKKEKLVPIIVRFNKVQLRKIKRAAKSYSISRAQIIRDAVEADLRFF